MNLFQNIDIGLVLCLLIPGYVFFNTKKLLIPTSETDYRKNILDVIGYSTLHGLLFYYPLQKVFQSQSIFGRYLLYLIVCIIFPILIGMFVNRVLKQSWFIKNTVGIHSTWDYIFSQRKTNLMIIELKNGKIYGGWYGSSSYASCYPDPREIFLESYWIIEDDCFVEPEGGNEGILISENEISVIKFYKDE